MSENGKSPLCRRLYGFDCYRCFYVNWRPSYC